MGRGDVTACRKPEGDRMDSRGQRGPGRLRRGNEAREGGVEATPRPLTQD